LKRQTGEEGKKVNNQDTMTKIKLKKQKFTSKDNLRETPLIPLYKRWRLEKEYCIPPVPLPSFRKGRGAGRWSL
jgi:hypothetical protein